MKFRKLGQGLLAAFVSAGLVLGVTSCANDHTVGYVYITGVGTTPDAGQVGFYKEDNNNGILTQVAGSPLGSAGSNPIREIIPAGGRFLFVLNAGVRTVNATTNEISYPGANISVFSIGGYGQLSFQHSYNSQGIGPIRMAVDSSGTHLFVLDSYAPIGNASGTIETVGGSAPTANFPCLDSAGIYRATGDVTAFAIDNNTGRLSIVSNQQQQSLTYFPVGCAPVDFHLTASYMYTFDAGSVSNSDVETVYVYGFSSSSGQLTQTQNAPQFFGNVAVDAITGDASNAHIYLIDPGASASQGGTIFPFIIGNNGALAEINSGPTINTNSVAGNPQQLISVTGSPNTFVYVANSGPASGTNAGNSDISGYVVNATTGHLDNPSYLSPYIGEPSGLVCLFEDPSNQFIYAVGSTDSTIAGRKLDPETGSLKPLNRATAFPTVGTPTWCTTTATTH